jgi:hypothetical protein
MLLSFHLDGQAGDAGYLRLQASPVSKGYVEELLLVVYYTTHPLQRRALVFRLSRQFRPKQSFSDSTGD